MSQGLTDFVGFIGELGFKEFMYEAQENSQQSFYINLNDSSAHVYFDGYVLLNDFTGYLLVSQQSKVLTLVLDDIQNEENLAERMKKFNLLFYTLRQYSESGTAKYTAEVLLLTKGEEQQNKIKQLLNHLASNSKSLHQIGVNTLRCDGLTLLKTQKALPWLLCFYRQWWEAANNNLSDNKLTQITQSDYRLKGDRQLKFDDNSHIHLVHGHNGSGKSSLAEAIELWLTGKIARLTEIEPKDYSQYIVHNQSQDKVAKLFCSINDNNSSEPTIKIDEEYQPDIIKCQSTSFSLNQEFIDGLSRASAKERLALLESAFFSDDKMDIEKYEKLHAELQDTIKQLSEKLGCANSLEVVLDNLDRICNAKDKALWEQHCLPVPSSILNLLFIPNKGFASLLERLSEVESFADYSEVLRQIDKASTQHLLIDKAQKAKKILLRIQEWHLTGELSHLSYEQLFKEWAKNEASIALLEKRLILDKVSHDTTTYADHNHRNELLQLHISKSIQLKPIERERASEQLEQFKALSVTLEQKLDVKVEGNQQAITQKSKATWSISIAESQLLDEVGIYLLDANGQSIGNLGKVLSDAVNQQLTSETANNLKMSQVDWANPLLQQLEQLIVALEQWEDAVDSCEFEPLKMQSWSKFYKDSLDKLSEYQQLKNKKEQRFLARFQGDNNLLANALNELLTLFTPSRWLYDDLSVSEDGSELKFTVNSESEERDASLLWNTAKLNLISVSLFLLCANYQPHQRPVNTLIMDDPLQNMDELTIIYLARGLAKIAYCVDDNNFNHCNQLVLLFHGEQAMAQFAEEVPAALYFLPWRNDDKQTEISSEKSRQGYKRMKHFDFKEKLTKKNRT